MLVRDDDALPPLPRARLTARRPAEAGAAGAGSRDLADHVARLRAAIATYVEGRRAAGIELGRVLPEVRALVRAAEAAEGWPDELEVLMAQVVGWTIAAYGDEPGLRGVPRVY